MNQKYTTGVILGSGLKKIIEKMTIHKEIAISDLMDTQLMTAGHSGQLFFGEIAGKNIVCCQGRPHWYEGREGQDFIHFIEMLKEQGVEELIITNASGGLSSYLNPGDLVLIKDHINFQIQSPLVGRLDKNNAHFLNQDQVYDTTLRSRFLSVAKSQSIDLPTGVYMAVLGPCFETPAEVRAFKILGADVVGMSSVPEVIAARYLGLKVVMLSVIVNMGAGMSNAILSHEHTLEMAGVADEKLARLLEGYFKLP